MDCSTNWGRGEADTGLRVPPNSFHRERGEDRFHPSHLAESLTRENSSSQTSALKDDRKVPRPGRKGSRKEINVTLLRKFKNTIFLHEEAAKEPWILPASVMRDDLYDIYNLRASNCVWTGAFVKRDIQIHGRTAGQLALDTCFICVCALALKITDFIKRRFHFTTYEFQSFHLLGATEHSSTILSSSLVFLTNESISLVASKYQKLVMFLNSSICSLGVYLLSALHNFVYQ